MWPEALRKSDASRAARVLPFNAITLSPEANWRQKSAFSMEKKEIHLAESSHRLVWYKKSWLIISEMNVITLILQYIQTHTPSLIYAQSAMENLCHFLLSKQYTHELAILHPQVHLPLQRSWHEPPSLRTSYNIRKQTQFATSLRKYSYGMSI